MRYEVFVFNKYGREIDFLAQKDGKDIHSADLIARDTVKRVQFFRRAWRNIMVLIGIK